MPLVVIAGRPNVGKSTLFNRLLRKRQSITDSQAGVTRDYIEGELSLAHYRVRLLDTGGVGAADHKFDSLVSERSKEMLLRADVLLLVLDYSDYTPEDQELLAFCRKQKTTILVLNKADRKQRDPLLQRELGFRDRVEISAAHGSGISDLRASIISVLDERAAEEGEIETSDSSSVACSIAILGKPNSGKSTLTNMLLGYERSLVSEIAGTTRDAVDGILYYRSQQLRIIDTAGLRRKSKVDDSLEYYSNVRTINNADKADVIFLLIDAAEGLSDQDKKIAHIAVRSGKAIILVLSKWDLVPHAVFRDIQSNIHFLFPQLRYAPVVPCSCHSGEGVNQLLNTAMHCFEQLQQRISTPILNKRIADWQHNLSASGRDVPAIKYATQISVNPVRFVLFAKRKLLASHQRYIVNRIRKELGFTAVPVEVEVKTRMT